MYDTMYLLYNTLYPLCISHQSRYRADTEPDTIQVHRYKRTDVMGLRGQAARGGRHLMSEGNPDRARRQTTLAAAAWKETAPAALPAATPSAAPAAAQLVRTPAPTADRENV